VRSFWTPLLSLWRRATYFLEAFTDDGVPTWERALQISVDSDFAQTVLLFPRSALKSRLGAAEPYIGRRIDGATGMGRLLSPLLRALPAPLDGIPTTARERVAGNLLDLIATALLPLSEDRLPSTGMTLVRVKLWIETHLGEALTAERISGACRMSVRHLNRSLGARVRH
jgi:hypothetical protein